MVTEAPHAPRTTFLTLLSCLLLCTTLLLSSCDLGNAPAKPHIPQRGGSIITGIEGDVESLLPFQPYGAQTLSVDQAIWTPLWYGDPAGNLHPGLAQELPSLQNGGISADEKTWTIRLRPNLKWSDGSPLTAADVAFSLNTYADPHFGRNGGFPLHDSADPIDFLGATVLDPITVRFTLAHPDHLLLAILADGVAGPIPREIFGAVPPGDIAKSQQGFFPTVVSGPFKMKEHVQGDHLTVVRNPNYYQGPAKPYLDQITFKFFPSQEAILSALQAGTVDTTYVVPRASLDRARELTSYSIYLDQFPSGYEALIFNLTSPMLKDLAVRQALTLSLDPRQVMALFPPGTAAPTCDDQAGTFAHESQLTCYPQDPLRAGILLDQDGWRLGPDGFRHKGSQTLTLRYSTYNTNNNAYRLQIEALAQAAWGRIGVKVTFQNYATHEFVLSVLPHGTFDIAEYFQWPSYDPEDSWFFMCNQTPDKGGANYMRYCNSAVDLAEISQQSTTDIDVRKAAYHTIHAIILADVPVMYLFSARQAGVYRSTLHNYSPSAVGADEMWNVWDWYLSEQ
jgi:peptide/nickel transport system substrate-binding protein